MDRPVYKSLTETYSSHFLERKGLLTPKAAFSFVRDVIYKGKLAELSSFIIWELLHKTGAWHKNDYLHFTRQKPLLEKPEQLFRRNNYELNCNSRTRLVRLPLNWSLSCFDSRGQMLGNTKESPNTLFRLPQGSQEPLPTARFKHEIKGIYISANNHIFVCSGGCLYRSLNKGNTFTRVLTLSTENSYFRHNNTFTERPNGDLFVGEYVCIWQHRKWHCAAYIYFSKDGGQNWQRSTFLQKARINKHIHILKYSHLLKGLVLTDGDNKKKLWYNLSDHLFDVKAASPQKGWKEVTRYHYQTGGYTAMVELNDTLFFGSDYLGGTNFLITTRDMKTFRKQIIPDPYRRAYFTNMLVRQTAGNLKEIWASLYAGYNSKTRCLLMYSSDNGYSWTKVIEYDGSKYIIEMVSSSLHTSGQIILQVCRRRGPSLSMGICDRITTPVEIASNSQAVPARSIFSF